MKLRYSLFAIFLLLLPFSALAQDDNRLQVAASYTILEDVVRQVAGDAADVIGVIPLNANPHNFMPAPRDIAALANADVVFINGAGFEEGLLEAIENAGADMTIVEASACVDILPFGAAMAHDHADEDHADEDHADEDHDHDHADEDHDHDHADEDHDHDHADHAMDDSPMAQTCAAHYAEMAAIHDAGHDHDEAHDEDEHTHEHADEHTHEHGSAEPLGPLYTLNCGGHAHEGEDHADDEAHSHEAGSCDMHVWSEPHNVMYWTMLIRDTLIELDPANAETYTANAAVYLETLDALAHDFIMPAVDSIPEDQRVLLTNHMVQGYFANRYGFEIAGTVLPSLNSVGEPSAAEVAALIDLVNAESVPAIFAETTVDSSIAEQIASETGAGFYVLFTGSLSDADGPAATYVDYTRYNVSTIVTALGGTLPE